MDAANIYASCISAFGRKIDYERLLSLCIDRNRVFRAIIYAVKHGDMDSWETALERMGYEIRVKEPVYYSDGNSKADWDIQMCVDIVQMVDGHCIDMPIVASGDGDFIPLVRWCQNKGRPVTVVGVETSTNRELKEVADIFIPIGSDQLRPEPVQTRQRLGQDAHSSFERPYKTPEQREAEQGIEREKVHP